MWSSRIWAICSQTLYWGLLLGDAHVHLVGKHKRVTTRGARVGRPGTHRTATHCAVRRNPQGGASHRPHVPASGSLPHFLLPVLEK